MIVYILKSLVCSGCLYLFYHLVLEQEKMYRFNRFFLLFSIVFSFSIPLLDLKETVITTVAATPAVQARAIFTQLPTVETPGAGIAQLPVLDWAELVLILYLLISLTLLVRFLRNILKLSLKISQENAVPYQDATLILVNEKLGAHSFLNYIFLDKTAYLSGKLPTQVLDHELSHVRQKHTFDILFIEVLFILAWFNPLLLFYRKAIMLNHEFLADESVLRLHNDAAEYQKLLLSEILTSNELFITSKFNYSVTKKRLIMMKKQANTNSTMWRKLSLIPVFTAAAFIFCGSVEIVQAQVAKDPAIVTVTKMKSQPGVKVDHQVFPAFGAPGAHTDQGVSESLMAEYRALASNYQFDEAHLKGFLKKGTLAQQSRMETIWKQMSIAQQREQKISFAPRMKPIQNISVSSSQLATWQDPTYGVWINGKRVKNDLLSDYKATDFGHVSVSKLYGPAKKENRTYQIDLMTEDYRKNFNKDLKTGPEYSIYYTINKYTK